MSHVVWPLSFVPFQVPFHGLRGYSALVKFSLLLRVPIRYRSCQLWKHSKDFKGDTISARQLPCSTKTQMCSTAKMWVHTVVLSLPGCGQQVCCSGHHGLAAGAESICSQIVKTCRVIAEMGLALQQFVAKLQSWEHDL